MATAYLQHAVPRQTPTPPPDTPQLSLETTHSAPTPIPNKHLAFCPPGPPASLHAGPSTPPDTPPSKESSLPTFSVLRPAKSFSKVIDQPAVYSIDAPSLQAATEELASEPLPDPKHTFPWLHGLHHENQMQIAFFSARRGIRRNAPKCFPGLTIVKAGDDMLTGRLRGAVSPEEVLDSNDGEDAKFLEVDPKEGFCVRNFQIQVAKIATISDIIVYRDENVSVEDLYDLAKRFSVAQSALRTENGLADEEDGIPYNTFVLSESFEYVENAYPGLVAVDGNGKTLDSNLDFSQMERREMCSMGKASPLAHNVWLGPTPDTSLSSSEDFGPVEFDIFIEANDLSTPPDPQTLKRIGEESYSTIQAMDFPSSGSILPQSWPKTEKDPLTRMCQWMYSLANRDEASSTDADDFTPDCDGDIPMRNLSPTGRKILIHCTDGYTETTLLGMAYLMFTEQIPVHEAWLRLHCERNRNFFAYPSDVALLQSLEPRLLSTRYPGEKGGRKISVPLAPAWLTRMDGSLPSRILPYLYLGNLGHANNPELLKELGIRQVLSIGEPVNWLPSRSEVWGERNPENVLYIDRIQDNGVDPLTGEIERCLKFIANGRANGTATLVHCRVGVSRSATVCIAEVMASMGLSFPRAYCLVRARRLNVIIQPHLRFVYELMKFDESCQQRRGERIRREMEWSTLCREIASMNKPYCSK